MYGNCALNCDFSLHSTQVITINARPSTFGSRESIIPCNCEMLIYRVKCQMPLAHHQKLWKWCKTSYCVRQKLIMRGERSGLSYKFSTLLVHFNCFQKNFKISVDFHERFLSVCSCVSVISYDAAPHTNYNRHKYDFEEAKQKLSFSGDGRCHT